VNLPPDDATQALTNADAISISGNLIFGQNPSSPIPNAKVELLDATGKNIIGRSTTNFFGSFTFNKIDPEETYLIQIISPTGLVIPSSSRIVLTNKNGKEIQVIRANATGKFVFNKLANESSALQEMKVDDSDLVMDLGGKILNSEKKNLASTQVILLDENGGALFTDTSDINGQFNFKSLKTTKNYILSVRPTDPTLVSVFLADDDGNVVDEIKKDPVKGFEYTMLANESNSLKKVYVDDPWIGVLNFKEKEITIQESVYYGSGEYKLDAAALNILDKVSLVLKSNPKINVEIGSHTDSRGNDDFNLTFSKKRADFAANYIISRGIAASRVKGVGYGETKIINKCMNGVECTDEEHAKNRRTEFRVINTGKK
jgi:outer membrane protein OmpA-like peptidoglycan-associated protein